MKQIISIILLLITMLEGASVDAPDVNLDPNRVIFSSEYSNAAWGFQKKVIIVLGDGRTYSYNQNQMAELEISPNGPINDTALKLIENLDPDGVMDMEYLLKMYSVAIEIDPDAKSTRKNVKKDYGQTNLYFYQEDGTKVLCASDGDWRYNIDDSNAKKVEKLWNARYLHYESDT
ncbi:MAG: hypothetical protein IK007_04910 [Lachnospiraceae bacterium]|nr:hypothetical protein [Lachnospiraceae bacterium]